MPRRVRKSRQKLDLQAAGASLNCDLFNADFLSIVRQAINSIFFMPTYEYSCQKCGQNFEAFQSMHAQPFQECPKELCRLPKWGHGRVKRLLGTGAGLIFKGSGFYITDYRSDSYKEAAKKESPATEKAGEKATAPKEAATKSPSPAPAKSSEKKPGKESAG
jgi:putative FmdB family regulatory protein